MNKKFAIEKKEYKGEGEMEIKFFMVMVKVQRITETIMLEKTSKIIKSNL